MNNEKDAILIVNLSKKTNPENGDKEIVITSARKVVADVDLVGTVTKQTGVIENINLSKTFIVAKRYYKEEKYLFDITKNELYQIQITAKDKVATNIKLNCSLEHNDEIVAKIKEYLK